MTPTLSNVEHSLIVYLVGFNVALAADAISQYTFPGASPHSAPDVLITVARFFCSWAYAVPIIFVGSFTPVR